MIYLQDGFSRKAEIILDQKPLYTQPRLNLDTMFTIRTIILESIRHKRWEGDIFLFLTLKI
jgi:hypothetical protein